MPELSPFRNPVGMEGSGSICETVNHKGHSSAALRAGSSTRRKRRRPKAFVKLRVLGGSGFCGLHRRTDPLPERGKLFLGATQKLQGKITQMARGWERKSVEQQQEEMSEQRKTVRAPISPEQQQRNRKREGLFLSRQRLTQQLQAASNARHRQMLKQAIAELDRQLSSFKQVTDSTSRK